VNQQAEQIRELEGVKPGVSDRLIEAIQNLEKPIQAVAHQSEKEGVDHVAVATMVAGILLLEHGRGRFEQWGMAHEIQADFEPGVSF